MHVTYHTTDSLVLQINNNVCKKSLYAEKNSEYYNVKNKNIPRQQCKDYSGLLYAFQRRQLDELNMLYEIVPAMPLSPYFRKQAWNYYRIHINETKDLHPTT